MAESNLKREHMDLKYMEWVRVLMYDVNEWTQHEINNNERTES